MQGSKDNDNEFVQFAERLAKAARAETLSRFRTGAEIFNKAGIWFDPVTDADREAERLLRKMIKAVYPAHGVIGEEFGAENDDAELRWVLDPVDGTRAFVCGIATWATLIALEKDGAAFVSVIDQPFTDESWTGANGEAHYERAGVRRLCRTSSVKELGKARISTTDPRRTAYFTSAEATAFSEIAETARLARFSLDAYAYGLLAVGELDLIIESGLKRHDFAALIPVVEGAGGVISDWRGLPLGDEERGRIVAAATPELHAAAIAKLKSV